MHLDEKNGGKDREVHMIREFRDGVQDYNLKDLGYTGHPFTWSNRRFGSHFVEERLGRFLCSNNWTNSF